MKKKAISVHEKNMELLDVGIYNKWIDKSIAKLSVLLPARYAKTEINSAIISLIQPEDTNKTASETVIPATARPDNKELNNNGLSTNGLGVSGNDQVVDKQETPDQVVTGG